MYQFQPPHPALRPYVGQYWSLKTRLTAGNTYTVEVFSDLRADLMFNFATPYQREAPDHEEHIARAHLDAARTYPTRIHQSGQIHLLGVRFRLGGLAAFVDVPAHEVMNLVVDPVDLFGATVADLESQLYDRRHDLPAQAALLDAFFLARLAPPDASPMVDYAAGLLLTDDVKAVSRAVGYSPRTLQRLFKGIYGVTPATYARVGRFRRAYHLLQRDLTQDLTALALAAGYYDLPHFSREFKAFTGVAPSAYQQNMSDLYKRFRAASSSMGISG